MSNKPVAWMLNGKLHECDPSDWAKEQYPDDDLIPLYTNPHSENLGLAESIIKQQQIEIEALKASHIELERGIVKDLNQRQSAEPVAWINRKGKDGEHGYLEWDKDDEAEINTPLYTHTVKELTDEEIEECCCFLDVRLHHRYEPNAVVKDIEWTVTGIKDFVEAILRKASEK